MLYFYRTYVDLLADDDLSDEDDMLIQQTIEDSMHDKYDVVLYVHVYNESIYRCPANSCFYPAHIICMCKGKVFGFAVFPPVYLKWDGPPNLILKRQMKGVEFETMT